jgi:hypothetical protein
VGASYGVFGSELVFGELEGSISRRAAMAAFQYRLRPELSLQVGAGMGHGGSLVIDGGLGPEDATAVPVRHEMLPGWVATLSGSWRVLDGAASRPLLLLTMTVGASGARTREEGTAESVAYTALDARLGVMVGKTLFDRITPYAALRAFGGPIFWQFRGEDRTGTDRYHYQVGLGLSASLPAQLDVFVEGVPLGERALVLGAGVAF